MTEENKAPVQDLSDKDATPAKKITSRKKIAIAATLVAVLGAAAYAVLFNQGYAPPLGGPCVACGMG